MNEQIYLHSHSILTINLGMTSYKIFNYVLFDEYEKGGIWFMKINLGLNVALNACNSSYSGVGDWGGSRFQASLEKKFTRPISAPSAGLLWLTPVILATQEAKIGGSPFEASLDK
jgi:hypothetical protein